MDEIATAVNFEGQIYIFCRSGRIFRMIIDRFTGNVTVEAVAELRL